MCIHVVLVALLCLLIPVLRLDLRSYELLIIRFLNQAFSKCLAGYLNLSISYKNFIARYTEFLLKHGEDRFEGLFGLVLLSLLLHLKLASFSLLLLYEHLHAPLFTNWFIVEYLQTWDDLLNLLII